MHTDCRSIQLLKLEQIMESLHLLHCAGSQGLCTLQDFL